ncbi:MAG: hypothetical protein ACKPKO_03385, partial [Candidatus Fonsibacter sp.]
MWIVCSRPTGISLYDHVQDLQVGQTNVSASQQEIANLLETFATVGDITTAFGQHSIIDRKCISIREFTIIQWKHHSTIGHHQRTMYTIYSILTGICELN